jgi:hypothetical protein
MQHISISQDFNAPIDRVFNHLANHKNLSSILGANIKRIKDAPEGNPNGKGSIRSIGMGIELLQEEVVAFEAPNLIEYTICSNAPIKYHLGRLVFTENNGITNLNYTIDLESKFAFADPILKFALETTIKNGLKKFAKSFR